MSNPLPIPHPNAGAMPDGSATHAQPYYVRDVQDWAIQQERMRHAQALWTLGEYCFFVLMWHIEDHEYNLVRRCPKCYDRDGEDSVKARVAATYNQPEEHRCPECFGTTFEGGYKALIVRPAIFSDADEDEQKQARGVMRPQDLSVESTPDFRVRSGDYCFRANGERYQMRVPNRVTLRTGFAMPTQSGMAIGYNHARASLEDKTSVAYILPPTDAEVTDILTLGSRTAAPDFYMTDGWKHPFDFDEYEVIRGNLIPPRND